MKTKEARYLALAAAVLVLAAVNFLSDLGASSLFVDEGLSWNAASAPLGGVVDRVNQTEISPPLHYLMLHEVLGRVSGSVIAMRLPSALAGIALVAAILWLGTLVAGRRAGLIGAALAAVSPLLLEYSQQARAYVFAMLGVTVAAAALVEAERRGHGAGGRKVWLLVSALSSILAFWTHYTAGLVIVPLFAGALVRRELTSREVLLAAGAVGVACIPTLPMLVDQLGQGFETGIAEMARLNLENVLEPFGAPFDTRFGYNVLTLTAALGALLVIAVAAFTLRAERIRQFPLARSLILPLALFPVIVLIAVTVLGPDVLITRYVAVAAPFMLVLLSAAAAVLPRRRATWMIAFAALLAVTGSAAARSPWGRYQDLRSAAERIADGDRPGDVVILTAEVAIRAAFTYHAADAQVGDVSILTPADLRRPEVLRRKPRLWILLDPPADRATIERGLATIGYRRQRDWRYPGIRELQLVLALPSRRRPAGLGMGAGRVP